MQGKNNTLEWEIGFSIYVIIFILNFRFFDVRWFLDTNTNIMCFWGCVCSLFVNVSTIYTSLLLLVYLLWKGLCVCGLRYRMWLGFSECTHTAVVRCGGCCFFRYESLAAFCSNYYRYQDVHITVYKYIMAIYRCVFIYKYMYLVLH